MGEGDQRAALQWQGAELSSARGLKYEITILLSIFNIFSIFLYQSVMFVWAVVRNMDVRNVEPLYHYYSRGRIHEAAKTDGVGLNKQ